MLPLALPSPPYGEDTATLFAVLDATEREWKKSRVEPRESGFAERQDCTAHVLITGGCRGADEAWIAAASKRGGHWRIEIYSFPGHHVSIPRDVRVQPRVNILTERDLDEAESAAREANARALKRRLPPTGYSRNLIRRNYFIVKNADALYAVGYLRQLGEGSGRGLDVEGGTAWGCEFFFERSRRQARAAAPPSSRDVNLFFFDLNRHAWFTPRACSERVAWERVPLPPPPRVFRRVAAIGTRDIDERGRYAIEEVFAG